MISCATEKGKRGVASREIASLSIIRFSKLGRERVENGKWEARRWRLKERFFFANYFYLFLLNFRGRGSIRTDRSNKLNTVLRSERENYLVTVNLQSSSGGRSFQMKMDTKFMNPSIRNVGIDSFVLWIAHWKTVDMHIYIYRFKITVWIEGRWFMG